MASWRFDDGAGRLARDSGGHALHGTLSGLGGPSWIAGVEATALRFDGNDYVALPDDTALEPARITVAAWVRSSQSPGRFQYIFSKGARICLRSAYGLYTGSERGAAFYVTGNGLFTVSAQAAPSKVWDGRWHRLAGTYDGARVRLYLDGVQVGAATPAPTNIEYGDSSGAPYIGTYRGDCELPFNGDIDDVAIWDGALTAAQARTDAVPPAETPAGGPVGPAPGSRSGPSELEVAKGKSTTPARCTSVALNRRTVRRTSRSTIVVTVRRGASRLSGARVVLRGSKLRKATRTNARGRARFVVRPSRGRLKIRVATKTPAGCGTPVAYVRVRR